MTEIARVKKGINNMETARAFAKVLGYNVCIYEIINMIRAYERDGLLVRTDGEVIMYHEY